MSLVGDLILWGVVIAVLAVLFGVAWEHLPKEFKVLIRKCFKKIIKKEK